MIEFKYEWMLPSQYILKKALEIWVVTIYTNKKVGKEHFGNEKTVFIYG